LKQSLLLSHALGEGHAETVRAKAVRSASRSDMSVVLPQVGLLTRGGGHDETMKER